GGEPRACRRQDGHVHGREMAGFVRGGPEAGRHRARQWQDSEYPRYEATRATVGAALTPMRRQFDETSSRAGRSGHQRGVIDDGVRVRARLPDFDQLDEFRIRKRRRDYIALALLNAAGEQRLHLLVGFDALGDDRHLQVPGEPHQGFDDPRGGFVLDGVDEEFVDLHGVGAERLQMRKSAMADADVVDRDLEAEIAQRAHDLGGLAEVLQLVALGDLEHYLPRRDLGFRHSLAQPFDEALAHEMARDDVEGELELLVLPQMRIQFLQCDPEDLPGHGADAPAWLGKTDEFHRRDDAAVRANPARQHFAADDLAGGKVEDGLEERPEFSARKRPIEIGDGTFDPACTSEQHAKGKAEAERGQHARPIAVTVGPGKRAILDADRCMERVAAGGLRHLDGVLEVETPERELRKLLIVVERQHHLAVRAQLGRHDVEQIGVDADDGDEPALRVDVAEHAERVAAELLDPEQAQLVVAGREHVGAVDPGLVELQRLGIGRADDRTVVIDEAHVLDGRALIDLQSELLQRRRFAIELAELG